MSISPYEFLLRELRQARSAAGPTQDAIGDKVHFSPQKISAIETGRAPLTRDLVVAFDAALNGAGRFVRFWDDLVKDASALSWLRDWIEIERDATVFRWYEHAFVPGLLQTEAYARATFQAARVPVSDLDQRVASRMERQAVLARDPAPRIFVVLDEMVVRRTCGGSDVMAEQLEHLVTCAEQPHVELHVVPLSAGIYSGLAGSFILADLPDGFRAGYVDNQLAAQIEEHPAGVASLRLSWDAVRSAALPSGLTLDLIKEVAKTWI